MNLEMEKIIDSTNFGNAKVYKMNFGNPHTSEYIKFLLNRESQHAIPYVRRWVTEIKKLKSCDAAILFGSVLRKQEEAKDIDVLLVTGKKNFSKLKAEVEEINLISDKKLHPTYQTKEDIRDNLKTRDKVILNAIKGIVVSGQDVIIDLMKK